MGAVVGLVTDGAEIIGQAPATQADVLGAAIVLAFTKTMTNKTYLQGLSDALDAISSPERGAEKYVKRFAQTLIPTAVRQVERVVDPTIREARSVLEAVQSVVPGWASSLPPRRNLFGDPIILQGGFGPDIISPIYTSRVGEDQVAAEIARHRIDVSMPSRILEGRRPQGVQLEPQRATEGVELSPQEYDLYVQKAGKPLRETLARIMSSPGYDAQTDGPDGGKALLIRHAIYTHRAVARAEMLNESDDIRRRHFAYQERRLSALVQTLGR